MRASQIKIETRVKTLIASIKKTNLREIIQNILTVCFGGIVIKKWKSSEVGHRVETVTLVLWPFLGHKDPRALEKPCGSSKGEMVVETCVRRQVSCRTRPLNWPRQEQNSSYSTRLVQKCSSAGHEVVVESRLPTDPDTWT